MSFTIAGIPVDGDLGMCHRLEHFDITAAFDIMIKTMVAILVFTIASPWILPSLYRGRCGCVPGMVCDDCIAGDESEHDEESEDAGQ